MRKLFVRFYLSVLAVLLLAWLIHGYVLTSRSNSDRDRVIVKAHGGGARLMAAELSAATPENRQARLLRIRGQFKYPVDLIKISDLPLSVRTTIANSNNVQTLRLTPGGEFVVVALADGKEAVRFGPFPDYGIFAIEDSLSGWVRLARDKINAADDHKTACAALQPLFDFPIVIVDRQDIPTDASKRIEGDRDVVFFTPGGDRWFVATQLAIGNEMLRLGPFPSFERIEQKAAATTLGLVLLPAAIAIALLLRPISNQLRRVEEAAKRIASGQLSARVNERGLGAARPMAQAFNNMAARTEKLVESQRELLQAVSHELRTPLSRIRFAIELIETSKDESERKKRLKTLETASDELDELVAELLRYVRLETTDTQLQREQIPVSEVLDSIVPKASYLNSNVQIEWHKPDSSGESYIEAERLGFQRAIGNLLNNAVRHARDHVSVSFQSNDSEVIIDVDDNGQGIPENERERVLEPFVRLDNQTDGNHRGVGLGLAIVKRIVSNHGGSIAILTSPIGGCRVRTSWPKYSTSI